MKTKSKNSNLHITFHNPNSKEETTDFIIKLIAENIAEGSLARLKD